MTDKQKINMLMVQRVIMEKDYPFSKYDIGTILIEDQNTKTVYANEGNKIRPWVGITMKDLYQYPHIFRKLEWWEYRDETELPDYVKFVNDHPLAGQFMGVIKWYISSNNGYVFDTVYGLYKPESTIPVTKEGYIDHVNNPI